MARLVAILVVALAIAGVGDALLAQAASGTIHGVVHEQAAAALRGVAVTATNVETGFRRRVISGAGGRFTVAGLPAGVYELSAVLDGFAEGRQAGIVLRPGDAFATRLQLRKAPLAETITLTDARSGLERMRGHAASGFAGEVQLLPLPSRNPFDVVGLSPLATRSAGRDAWSGLGLSPSLNSTTLDGVTSWNPVYARPIGDANAARGAYQVGQHSLQDLKIVAGAPRAEYGGAAGLFVDAVTRSGSSRYAGELFGRYRDSALAAATPIDRDLGRAHALQHANQFGGTFGGPIAPRHVFFVSYDGLRSRSDNVVAREPLSILEVAQLPLPLVGALDSWPQRRTQDVGLVRTDHAIASGVWLMLRYSHHDVRGTGVEREGSFIGGGGASTSTLGARSFAAGLGTALGNHVTNELRVQYGRDRDRGTSPAGPQVVLRDEGGLLLVSGGDAANPHDVQARGWHVTDAVTLARGRHTLKIGGDVRLHDVSYRTGALTAGSYLFEDVDALNGGPLPLGTTQTFFESFVRSGDDTAHVTPRSQDYSAFIQDTIRMGDRLTVDAGLRYDRQVITAGPPLSDALEGLDAGLATTPGADTNNWAPRLGLAWTLSRRLVAHASYGVTSGGTPLGLVAAAQLHGSGALALHTFGFGDSPRPGFPTEFDSAPPGNLPIVVVFDRAFERPRVHGGSAGLEWEWMPQTSLTLTYLHATGRHLPRAVERNVGAPGALVFTESATGESLLAAHFSPGPFGGVSRLVAIESTGESTYNGLSIELRRDLSQGIHYRLGYILSKATDTGSIDRLFPAGPDDRLIGTVGDEGLDRRAPADSDQRHRFVSSVIYFTDSFASRRGGVLRAALDDWRISATYLLQGGLPYTAWVAADLNGDRNIFNDIAPGTSRNAFRRGKEGRLDARVAREFALGGVRVTPSVDLFNVFNAAHGRQIDDTLYARSGTTLIANPRFGRRFSPEPGRTAQLGLSMSF